MIFVKKAILGDMVIEFQRPLQVIGCDEYNVYLSDRFHEIDGLPYIRTFTKDWSFVEASNGRSIFFPFRI